MSSKAVCSSCANRRHVDTLRDAPPNTVWLVEGGPSFCFAPENEVDPLTGEEVTPPRCSDANPVGACPFFNPTKSSFQEGRMRIRGGREFIAPEPGTSAELITDQSPAVVAANLDAESKKAPPPPPPPWQKG